MNGLTRDIMETMKAGVLYKLWMIDVKGFASLVTIYRWSNGSFQVSGKRNSHARITCRNGGCASRGNYPKLG